MKPSSTGIVIYDFWPSHFLTQEESSWLYVVLVSDAFEKLSFNQQTNCKQLFKELIDIKKQIDHHMSELPVDCMERTNKDLRFNVSPNEDNYNVVLECVEKYQSVFTKTHQLWESIHSTIMNLIPKIQLDESRDCTICNEDIESGLYVVCPQSSNKHVYHIHCALKLKKHSNDHQTLTRCPMCRSEWDQICLRNVA